MGMFAWRYFELNIICGDSFWDYFLLGMLTGRDEMDIGHALFQYRLFWGGDKGTIVVFVVELKFLFGR